MLNDHGFQLFHFLPFTNISAKHEVFDVEQESLPVPKNFLAQSSRCDVVAEVAFRKWPELKSSLKE